MNNIQDLLRLYLDTSIILDNCEKSHADEPLSSGLMSEIESIRRRKIEIESQIVELFGQAEKRGAEVEREAVRRIIKQACVEDCNPSCHSQMVRAIDARDTESGEESK